jgi:hypothetical protein
VAGTWYDTSDELSGTFDAKRVAEGGRKILSEPASPERVMHCQEEVAQGRRADCLSDGGAACGWRFRPF